MTRTRAQVVLMDYLTPLGVLFYGAQLVWWEALQQAILRRDATHADLNEAVCHVHRLQNILDRKP